jgi:nucleoside-diphosphate-sugar epimerase
VNLSSEEWITVLDSVQLICSSMQLSPKVIAGTSKEGWIGDDPNMILNIGFMKSLGLSTNKSIRESIVDTTNWLVQNPWIFQKLK